MTIPSKPDMDSGPGQPVETHETAPETNLKPKLTDDASTRPAVSSAHVDRRSTTQSGGPSLERLLHGLRLFGAAMVATAAGTFLVQRWENVGDITRYLALLGVTALVPLVAYLCGVRLRESRSARVLLITLLALLPIHAGVLAGFVLSQFGASATSVAPVAQWVAPSPIAAVLVVLGAGAVLVPIAWFAYRVLAREHAKRLTLVSASLYGLLLVPSRSALVAMLLVAPMVACASWCAVRTKPKTREAKIAVASLFGPVVLLLSRQVWFYDAGLAFWGMVLGLVSGGLFMLSQQLSDDTLKRFSVIPMLASTACFWLALSEQIGKRWNVDDALLVVAYGWLAALPLGLSAWRSPTTRSFFLWTLAVVNAVLVLLALLIHASPWVALEAIALGLFVGSHGYLTKRPFALYAGAALVIPGAIVEVNQAMQRFEPSGWLALAGFGLGLVGLTAWVEQRQRASRSRASGSFDESAVKVSSMPRSEVPQ
ncbi:MAG: hypothetical protein AAF997_01215 [Myxococcota bacterium]